MDPIEAFYNGSVDNLAENNTITNKTTHRGQGDQSKPRVNQTQNLDSYAVSACEYSDSNQDYKASPYRLLKHFKGYITRSRRGAGSHLHQRKQDHQKQREQQQEALVSSSEALSENSSAATTKCSCQKLTHAWIVFQIVHALFTAAALAICVFLLGNFFLPSPKNVDMPDLMQNYQALTGVRMPLNWTQLPAARVPLTKLPPGVIGPKGHVNMEHEAPDAYCVGIACNHPYMEIEQQGIYFVFFSVLVEYSGHVRNDTFAAVTFVNEKSILQSDHTWSDRTGERSTLTNGGIFQLQRKDEIRMKVSETDLMRDGSFFGMYMLAPGGLPSP